MRNPLLPLVFILICGLGAAALGQDNKAPDSIRNISAEPFSMSGPTGEAWKTVRGKQPAGVHLTLTLPKTHYYLGEVIMAKLAFSNESKQPWHLWIGTYDRSGRILDIAFNAEGADGMPVGDPLKSYFEHFLQINGGLGNFDNLGKWEITLPANQWLKFEKPGVYQLYARSTRVTPGDKDVRYDQQKPAVELVSDPVTITIDPLSEAQEKEIIAKAEKDLSGPPKKWGDETGIAAIERLRFLQTPAACDALLQYVDSPYGEEAALGIYARADYPADAARILAAVKEQRLGLGDNLLRLYSGLKNGTNMEIQWFQSGTAAKTPEPQAKPTPREELYAAARSGITEDGTGDIYFANLLAVFRADPHEAKARAIMVRRQLDLPQRQIDELLNERDEKSIVEDRDFLPLLRDLVKPEKHNPYALKVLAALAPDEARPIIIEDIKRDRSIYVPTDHAFRPDMDYFALEALPDKQLPELDPVLRSKLQQQVRNDDQAGIWATVCLIERYATKALLPDVVRVDEKDNHNSFWLAHASMLRYRIRNDRQAGLLALARIVKKDGGDMLTEVVGKEWVDEALPLVESSLRSKDLQVIRSAAPLLEAHAGPEAIDKVIDAVEEVAARPVPKEAGARDELLYVPRELTELLINSKRWTLTRPQIERLRKAAIDKGLKEQLAGLGQQSPQ